MKCDKPRYLDWLTSINHSFKTIDGNHVKLLELTHQPDDTILSLWAKHFREHYCKITK